MMSLINTTLDAMEPVSYPLITLGLVRRLAFMRTSD